jgi:hypothetical protein
MAATGVDGNGSPVASEDSTGGSFVVDLISTLFAFLLIDVICNCSMTIWFTVVQPL